MRFYVSCISYNILPSIFAMGSNSSKTRVAPSSIYAVAPTEAAHTITGRPCTGCTNTHGPPDKYEITLMCGHTYQLCYKMNVWISDLVWCPACRIAPPNRGRILDLIYESAHANTDPRKAGHAHDAPITGVGADGYPLPEHLYDPLTQTWASA